MSLFFGGKKKKEPVDNSQKLIQAREKLTDQVSVLDRKRQIFEKQRMELAKQARGMKKKEEKIRALRKIRMIDNQIKMLQGQSDNLTAQVFALETAQIAKGSVDAIKAGQQAMLANGIDHDTLAEELDEVQDTMQDMREVQETLATPMFGEVFDDDELLADFEAEEAEEALEDLDIADIPEDLPNLDDEVSEPQVSKPVSSKKNKEDAELAALGDW